ncbi:hypothetical protein [Streptacidiphilus rugosus]|uniref:hypothetical protein n=1 Tax=Streptacidiphilus rugosus TaxID=405783 RepID=UPI00055DAF34|nr:hypothetical protein [Streptacidiphilus rugosus]
MTDDRIRAPWDEADVAALNAFQRSGRGHPFTCGAPHRLHQTLIAEPDGWHCPDDSCDFRQEWAYAAMAAAPGFPPALVRPVVPEYRDGSPVAAELTKVRQQLRATEFDLGQERQRNVVLAERLAAEKRLSETLRFELQMIGATRPVPATVPDPDGGLCDADPYVRAVADVPTRGWL